MLIEYLYKLKSLRLVRRLSLYFICMSQQNLPYTPQQSKDMSQLRTLSC